VKEIILKQRTRMVRDGAGRLARIKNIKLEKLRLNFSRRAAEI